MPRGGSTYRRGGRKKNTPNKATVERLEKARLAAGLKLAQDGEQKLNEARTLGKLGVDVIEDLMNLFYGITMSVRPSLPGEPENKNYNEDRFEKYGTLALKAAAERAKYQSPQFRAIQVAPAPDSGSRQRKRFTLTIFENSQPLLEARLANDEKVH